MSWISRKQSAQFLRPLSCFALILFSASFTTIPMFTTLQTSQTANPYDSLAPVASNPLGSGYCSSIVYQSGPNVVERNLRGQNQHIAQNATSILQQALNRGGTICVSPGTYLLDHGLAISSSRTTFRALGERAILTFATRLSQDNLLTIGLGNHAFVNPISVDGYIQNVTVSGFNLDGEKDVSDNALVGLTGFETQNMGIFVIGGRFITIQNVTVRNVGQYGIYFRASSPNFSPSSPIPLPNIYNSVVGNTVLNSRSGILVDGVAMAPSETTGVGNRIVGNTVIQDWSKMNIDVPEDDKGFGIMDIGNFGTAVNSNHIQGYTPNPLIPSHTHFGGIAFDGNSSAIVSSNLIDDSYEGIDFGPAGYESSGHQTIIDNLTTSGVRYSVMIEGPTENVTVRNLRFIDPKDTINDLAGVGVLIGADVSAFHVHNINGSLTTKFRTFGQTAILQTASNVFIGKMEIVGGAMNNLDLDFLMGTYPAAFAIHNISGYNPIGQISTPFNNICYCLSPFGDTSGPSALTPYTVQGTDDIISVTGGVGVSITVTDPNGASVVYSGAPLARKLVPQGYTIDFGAFTDQPTVTVDGD